MTVLSTLSHCQRKIWIPPSILLSFHHLGVGPSCMVDRPRGHHNSYQWNPSTYSNWLLHLLRLLQDESPTDKYLALTRLIELQRRGFITHCKSNNTHASTHDASLRGSNGPQLSCPMYKTEPRARQYALQSVNAADIFCPVQGKTMPFPSIALQIILICPP